MSRKLALKDFEGLNRLTTSTKSCSILLGPDLEIESSDFEFKVKIRSRSGHALSIGIAKEGFKIKKTRLRNNPTNGWGWYSNSSTSRCIGPTRGNGSGIPTAYKTGDIVRFAVKKKVGKIWISKNDEPLFLLFKNVNFPDKLFIIISVGSPCDAELVEFKQNDGPLLAEEEEEEEGKDEKKVKTITELSKSFEELKAEIKREVGALESKVLKLDAEKVEISKKFEKLKAETGKKILNLQTVNSELRKEVEELKKREAERDRRFVSHFNRFHQTKFSISETTITPPIMKREDNSEYCLLGDILHFQLTFSIISGPSLHSQDNERINFDEFGPVRIHLNRVPITNFRCAEKQVEFDVKFTELGRNELEIQFQNLKKVFSVHVEPSSLSVEKTNLSLIRGSLEPDGSISIDENMQPTDKFSSVDLIQVVLQFVNENGVPICRHKEVEGFFFSARLTSEEGTGRPIPGVLSRSSEIMVEKEDLKSSEFIVCTIGEKKSLESGTYTILVYDAGFTKRKKFVIV